AGADRRRVRREDEVDAQPPAGDNVTAERAQASEARRHIWLCADDYGIAPGVNQAIRDLILRGRLNATSVMVVTPSFSRSEELAHVRRTAPDARVRKCGSVLPLRERLHDRKGLVLDYLSRRFRARARAFDIAVNPAFAGTYDFTADADFAKLFPGFLARLPDGGVIMCHPGHVDDELVRLDPLTTLRERE